MSRRVVTSGITITRSLKLIKTQITVQAFRGLAGFEGG